MVYEYVEELEDISSYSIKVLKDYNDLCMFIHFVDFNEDVGMNFVLRKEQTRALYEKMKDYYEN
jgi:hypothetical protein